MQESSPLLFSQSRNIRFEHFSLEHGLSYSNINSICKDRKGFLWIGTVDGLNRYDGHKFKIFRKNPDDPNSLSNNFIWSIYEDSSGNLWIGTHGGGLNKFNPKKEQFTIYRYSPDDPNSLSNDDVYSICEDNSGLLWIGTTGGGLNKFDKEKEQFECYINDPDDPTSLSSNHVVSICEDNSGNLWIGTFNGGLNKFDKEKDQFKCYANDPDDPTSIGSGNVQPIYQDSFEVLWIGTTGGGLNKFDKEKEQFIHCVHDSDNPTSLSNNKVTSIFEDSSHNLWFGTWGGGLNLFDREKEQFIHYKNNPNDPASLGENKVTSIFEDNSGIIWIGTYGGGLDKFYNKGEQFVKFIYNPYDETSLRNSDVISVYEDKSGKLWIGTQYVGLTYIDRSTNKIKHYKHNSKDLTSLSHDSVSAISEDYECNLWIGTFGGGLNRFDINKKKFINYRHDNNDPNSLISNLIVSIYEDKSGKLWIGTASGGLSTFDKKQKKFINFVQDSNKDGSLSGQSVYYICEDNTGNLWIATNDSGLNRFDKENQKFINYRHDPNDAKSLISNLVLSVLEDNCKVLWVGTSGGLDRFDRENEEFTHFTVKNGLPNDFVCGILEDDNGNLWLSTHMGLSKFNIKTETFRNYDVRDGLHSNVFHQKSFCKTKSGEMIFGGRNGFTVFHPDNIKDNPHIPPIAITDLKLLHKSVPIGFDKTTNRTILEKSITETEEIELNYEDNVITLEFAALDFRCPEKNQYAYMMEGFDKDWIHTDASKRFATYTNLDPGEYTFRVKGSNNDGIWNEEGTSLKVKILPEMRSRFFADISHEFRTPLTLILGPLKQIIEETKESKTLEEASIAEKSAERLNVLVNQLLDLSRVATGNMKLQACAENIIPLIKGLTLSFASLAERKSITLKFISKRKILKIYVDRDKLEKIVTNILLNAFKFTEEGGRIDVSVRSSDNTAEIRISDTGIGIPKEKLDKIFDRFYKIEDKHKRRGEGTGIGLALTKELIDLHKGEIEVESEEGKGTTFIVSLPLGKDHLLPEEIIEVKVVKEEELVPIIAEADEDKEEEIDIDLITETEKPLLLIVEDNSDVRKYIKGHLEVSYRILEAVDGRDGMDKAIEFIPDLIVSDVIMPEMDGFELCKELKNDERTSHIPVILLTAKATSEDKIEGLETGADDYIMKPFDAKELQIRIKNLIEQRKKLRERFNKEIAIPIMKGKYSQIDEEFLKKIMEVINKHISEPEFSLDDFGKETGMSRTQLHRKVRALTNHSPHNFIRFIRLKHAAELLSKGAGNVTEIAYDVGFSSLSHFAKAFKEQFGKTPSDYTKSEK